MQDGNWCHVLTLMDADTRYLLRAEPMLDPTGSNVEKVLDSAFQEFGLPKAMRTDNGPPFASSGAGRLSRLSVWWLKLGSRARADRALANRSRMADDAQPRTVCLIAHDVAVPASCAAAISTTGSRMPLTVCATSITDDQVELRDQHDRAPNATVNVYSLKSGASRNDLFTPASQPNASQTA